MARKRPAQSSWGSSRVPKKPRGVLRRRFRKTRITKNPQLSVYNIQRNFHYAHWVPSTVAVVDFWKQVVFTANNLPDFSQLQSIFDEYKINGIRVRMMPRSTEYAGNDNTAASTRQPTNFVSVRIDPMDQLAAAGAYTRNTYNTFCERGKVAVYTGIEPIDFFFRPMIGDQLQTGVSRVRPMWINSADGGVEHYGFNCFFHDPNFAAAFTQTYDVFVTYYMQFRGVR